MKCVYDAAGDVIYIAMARCLNGVHYRKAFLAIAEMFIAVNARENVRRRPRGTGHYEN